MVWSAEKWSPLVTPPRTPYRNLGLMDIPPHTSQLTYRLQSTGPAMFSGGSLIEISKYTAGYS